MRFSHVDRDRIGAVRKLPSIVTALVVLITIFCARPALAASVWTDGNGDGLPDGDNLFRFPGEVLVADVWIDSDAFAFTAYQVTVEHSGLSIVDAEYVISGGTNAPIDLTSRANSVIFSGSEYEEQGVRLIGRIRYDVGFECGFVRPVIDSEDLFPSRLSSGGGSEQFYFQSELHSYTTLGEWFEPHTCCLPDGSCLITYESCECDAAGGLHLGEGVSCENCASATDVSPAGTLLHALEVVPNPAADGVRVTFRLDREEEIDLAIYDASGRRIRALVSGSMPVGVQSATWDRKDDNGRDIAAGTYFLRLTSSHGDQVTERVTVVR